VSAGRTNNFVSVEEEAMLLYKIIVLIFNQSANCWQVGIRFRAAIRSVGRDYRIPWRPLHDKIQEDPTVVGANAPTPITSRR
jgi:hypothetical protein